MKLFDLEAALNGEQVVTRDNKKVSQLTYFETISDDCLCGVISGEMHTWTNKGKYYEESATPFDLFMADNDQSFWVARVGDNLRPGTYSTKQECQMANPDADGYHKITYNEQL